MRAEVAAADPRGVAMTWYMVTVAAVEAAGTATAALLPTGPGSLVSGGLLIAVIACYGGALLPTWLVAAGARVPRARPAARTGPRPTLPVLGRAPVLASGGLVMLLGSGPTLLAVGLAAELHGTRWVAGSALAFAVGSLLAPVLVARLERLALPPPIAWPALGVGMAAGWTFAAWHPLALLAAQLLSGMCMSALEGDMDARVAAGNASPRGVTAGLATAAALRAFGSATAVALAPRVIAEAGIGWLGAALATGLATLALGPAGAALDQVSGGSGRRRGRGPRPLGRRAARPAPREPRTSASGRSGAPGTTTRARRGRRTRGGRRRSSGAPGPGGCCS